MLSSRQSRRAQNILLLTGLFLALYYFFVFRPIDRKAAELDSPLQDAWKKLSAVQISTGGQDSPDLDNLKDTLDEARIAVRTLQSARESIEAAVAMDPSVRERMREPFQLVDFQIEQLLRIEELGRAAQKNKVAIAPAVFAHFPEYQADHEGSELLWGQLALLHKVLNTAVQSQVSVIRNVELPPMEPRRTSTNAPVFLYEIPIQVELVGSMESVTKMLQALPRTGSETSDEGTHEPALFIERIVLRKSSTENPDEMHLDLRVVGFVYSEVKKK